MPTALCPPSPAVPAQTLREPTSTQMGLPPGTQPGGLSVTATPPPALPQTAHHHVQACEGAPRPWCEPAPLKVSAPFLPRLCLLTPRKENCGGLTRCLLPLVAWAWSLPTRFYARTVSRFPPWQLSCPDEWPPLRRDLLSTKNSEGLLPTAKVRPRVKGGVSAPLQCPERPPAPLVNWAGGTRRGERGCVLGPRRGLRSTWPGTAPRAARIPGGCGGEAGPESWDQDASSQGSCVAWLRPRRCAPRKRASALALELGRAVAGLPTQVPRDRPGKGSAGGRGHGALHLGPAHLHFVSQVDLVAQSLQWRKYSQYVACRWGAGARAVSK